MKNLKKIIALSLVAFSILGLTACGDKKETKAKLPEKITIATSPDFPPYEYMEGDKITGAEIDLIKKIMDNIGVKYEFKSMAFDGLLPGLASGKLDFGASAFSIEDKRKDTTTFSDPVFENKTSIVSKKSDAYEKKEDLANKKVAYQSGTTSADYVNKTLKEQGTIGKGYESYAQAFIDLENGKIDAIVMDNIPAEKFLATKPDLQLSKEMLYGDNYGFAVKKGNHEELMKAVNAELKKLKDNGEYDKIIKPHFDKQNFK